MYSCKKSFISFAGEDYKTDQSLFKKNFVIIKLIRRSPGS